MENMSSIQTMLDIAFGASGALMMFALKAGYGMIRDLEVDMKKLSEEVHRNCAHKEDIKDAKSDFTRAVEGLRDQMRGDIAKVEVALEKIFERLETKVDK